MQIHRARRTAGIIALLLLGRIAPLQAVPERVLPATLAEQYLFAAANADRAQHHLAPLRSDSILGKAAKYHAEQMAERADISHQFPGEPELAERGTAAGARFSLVSENVAEAPNPATIHNMWMESEGHRANLLDDEVNVVGIAVVMRDGQFYAVEDFARTLEGAPLEEQASSQPQIKLRRQPRPVLLSRRAWSAPSPADR